MLDDGTEKEIPGELVEGLTVLLELAAESGDPNLTTAGLIRWLLTLLGGLFTVCDLPSTEPVKVDDTLLSEFLRYAAIGVESVRLTSLSTEELLGGLNDLDQNNTTAKSE